MFRLCLCTVFLSSISPYSISKLEEILNISGFLDKYDKTYGQLLNQYTLAEWKYNTDITDANAVASREAAKLLEDYSAEAFKTVESFDKEKIKDHPDLLRYLKKVGGKSLPEDESAELASVIQQMGEIYGSTKVCLPDNNSQESCFNLEPELSSIMAESTNYTTRLHVWTEWRRLVGQRVISRPCILLYYY